MEVVVVLLVAGIVGAGAAAWLYRNRMVHLTTERTEALTRAAQALGRTPASLSDGLRGLTSQRDDAVQQMAFIRRAVEGSASGVVVFDGALEVMFATDPTRRVLGGGPGAAEAAAALRNLARASLASGGTDEARLEITSPDRLIYRATARPMSSEFASGVVVHIVDVTERERLDAIRRDFVANVSHELKTPVGALSVLAEAIGGERDETTRRRLEGRMQVESERVARLVGDILDLSLVEADDREAEKVVVADIVAEAVRATSVLAEDAGTEVVVEQPGLPFAVIGDRRQLISALANLVDNAIKYSAFREAPERRVSVRVRREGDMVVIAVEDKGAGIAEPHQARVFERFYRIDRGRSRERGGTGLGLSIVRHVALNHGGTVELSSTPGVGSRFDLRLPLAED